MVLNATRDVRVSFEMAFLQFQSWNFAGMDNYLQDKLGATEIKVQKKKTVVSISSITLTKTVTMF